MAFAEQNESKSEKDQELQQALSRSFKILSKIGQGGMATVYRAENLNLGTHVALKILNSEYADSEITRLRFANEAKICSQLEHPNIVQIKSFGLIQESTPYIVMELLNGQNLSEFLQKETRLNPENFKQIFIPVLDAIEFAHSRGMLHRDISPSNIYLNEIDSAKFQIKVLDFGIAKKISTEQGQEANSLQVQQNLTTGILGCPLYMSPEQAEGKSADFRSDVYSLATVMFHAIEGKPPFESNTVYQTMYQRSKHCAPELTASDYPEKLTKAISKCLNRNPAERFQSISELKKEVLTAFEESNNSKARNALARRKTAYLPIGLSLFLLGSAFFFYKYFHDKKQREIAISTISPKSALHQFGKLKQGQSFSSIAFREAEELREKNLLPEAIEKYKEQLAELSSKTKDRDDLEKVLYKGHRNLADLYNQNKQPELAFAEYEKTLKIFDDPGAPNRINIFVAYANELTQQGQIKKAITMLKKNLKSVEDNSPARSAAEYLATLAGLEEKEQNYAAAEKLNDRAIQNFGQTRWGLCTTAGMNCVFTQYNVCRKQHKDEKARDLIQLAKDSIPADAPKTPGAHFALANHAKEFPELREIAIESFKKAIDTARLDDTPGENRRIQLKSTEYLKELTQQH